MNTFRSGVAFMLGLLIMCCIAFSLLSCNMVKPTQAVVVPEARSTEFQKAFFEAAKVYGRAGCGDQQLAEMTARESVATGLPAALIAAQASGESTCNTLAISNRGAVGLMQIMPKMWSKQFDFTKVNLLNPEENMDVSANIVSKLVKQYGVRNALIRYYGTGNDGIGLGGAGYADKILKLAGKL